MKNRRQFLQQTTLGLTGCCLTAGCSSAVRTAAPSAQRPNFVFILCDDLGYGDLGCYGHSLIQTPNLDRLSEQGMRLTDCYSAAPVCSPARAGALSGRNPYRCKIPDWIPHRSPIHLQSHEISVATLLRDAGYETAHYGKWHLNGTLGGSQPTPSDHGFIDWSSTQNNALPSHRNPNNFIHNGEPVGPRTGYSSRLIVDDAVRFLEHRGESPFALFVWFHAPHEPIATAKPFVEMYEDVRERERAIYYGNVSQMDHEVGRLLHSLDTLGLRDETFVMFTSDNGPEALNRYNGAERSYGVTGPLRGMKLHLYEGGIRVPGIVHWPGRTEAGATCNEPVCGTDILPTFCELAGAKLPDDRDLDGTSFTPILRGGKVERERPLYWRYDRAIGQPKVALRDGDWKILADNTLETFELYNLKDDIGETNDRAQREPIRLKSMIERLRALHHEIESDPISESIA